MRLQIKKKNALTFKKKMSQILTDLPGIARERKPSFCGVKQSLFASKFGVFNRRKKTEMDQTGSEKLEDWLIKNTSDLIKQEFDRIQRHQNFEDEVWAIQSDKVKNYKEYFPESNAYNL